MNLLRRTMAPDELLPDSVADTRPDAPTPQRLSLVAVAVERLDEIIAELADRRDVIGQALVKRLKRTRADLCSWDVGCEPTDDVRVRVLQGMRELEEQAQAVRYG